MVVTAAAVKGEAHPGGADGFGHVHDVVDAVFFGDGSALAIDGVISEEAGSEFLLVGGIGQEVSSDLPNREVVEGKVAIESVGNPVPPRPHCALVVALITIGVGVAGGIEPGPGHTFPEGRVGKEAVDEVLPGLGRLVGEKGVDLCGSGREATEIERTASDEGPLIGFGREGEIFFLKPFQDEGIEGMWIACGQGRFFDPCERPVLLVVRALLDPSVDEGFFGI